MNLCSDCGYSAKTKQAFNDHFAKHENEKLVCDRCGKTFDTPGRLRSHNVLSIVLPRHIRENGDFFKYLRLEQAG